MNLKLKVDTALFKTVYNAVVGLVTVVEAASTGGAAAAHDKA